MVFKIEGLVVTRDKDPLSQIIKLCRFEICTKGRPRMDTLVSTSEFNRLGAIVSPIINRLIDYHKNIKKW